MLRLRFRLLSLVVLAALASAAASQPGPGPLPLFAEDSALELRIEGPFRQLQRDDGEERPERDATLEYLDAAGRRIVLDVKIRVRGKTRQRTCDYPPLDLNFPRDQLEGTIFAGQNKLKLVVLCKHGDDYREYLAQEHQIYRMFSTLTDRSFRVRWANIEYVDPSGRRPESYTEPAFLIEEDWEVAARHQYEVVEVPAIDADSLDLEHLTLLSLFQFMIGNEDFSLLHPGTGEDCCHNGKLIADSDGALFLLPYDFDFSGLIDASYAAPPDQLDLRTVRERAYLGLCVSNGLLPATIEYLNSRREALESIVDDERVRAKVRRSSLAYLDEAYVILNGEDNLRNWVIRHCRGDEEA